MRKCPGSAVNVIDGVSSGIPDHFALIYSKLYNSVDEKDKLGKLLELINRSIDNKNIEEIREITPEVV